MKDIIISILSLGIVKLTRMIIPILIIPLIQSNVDDDYLALYFLANLVAGWVSILVDYGFDYSIVRKISNKVGNNKYTIRTINGVNSVKITISIGLLAVWCISSLFLDDEKAKYILIGLFLGISQSFIPVWLYMADNKAKKLSLYTLVSNLMALLMAFYVHNNQDLQIMLCAIIATRFFVAILLTYQYNNSIILSAFSIKKCKLYFSWGNDMFKFQFLSSLYTTFPGFYYGTIGSSIGITSFGVADRIIKACGSIMSPIIQVAYPYVCRMINAKDSNISKNKTILACIQVTIAFLIVILIQIFSEVIVYKLVGRNDLAVYLTKIYSLSIFFVSISNVFGVQGLLAKGFIKLFNKVIYVVTFTHIPILILLANSFHALGVSIAIVLSELLAAVLMFVLYRKINHD